MYKLHIGLTFVAAWVLAKTRGVSGKKAHWLPLALNCPQQILDHLWLMPLIY